jgi:hypothetical protein
MHRGVWWQDVRGRANFEDLIIDRSRVITEVNIAEIRWEALLDWINP